MDFILKIWQFLDGKKTYLVALGLAWQWISPFIHGDITLGQLFEGDALTKLLESLGLSTLRAGVKKSGPV